MTWLSCRQWVVGLSLVALALPAPAAVTWADESPHESFTLTGDAVAPAAALATGELKLVFDWRDERSYDYLSLHAEKAQFYRVREGKAEPLGVAGTLRRARPAERLSFALLRHDWSAAFVCNQVVCARAEDRSLPPGRVGREVSGAGLSVGEFELQDAEDIYLADDFMRVGDAMGGWESLQGRWENNQQGSKSSRSANAFTFRSAGASPCLAAVGYPSWSDYVAQAAVHCEGTGAVGLAVAVVDAQHYYRLRWTSARHPDGGTCRLQRVFGDQVTDLTPPVPGGFRDKVWYKLQLALSGGRLRAWIDDAPVCEVAAQAFGQGRVGLWTEPGPKDTADTAGASFDDVVVRSWPLFADDFTVPAPGRWTPVGEPWKPVYGADGRVDAPGTGTLLAGADDWADLTWEADVRADSGTVGLLVHGGAGGGYALRCGADTVELVKLAGGQPVPLDHAALKLDPSGWHHLSLSWEGGLLRGAVDRRPVVEAFDAAVPAGRCGLLTDGAVGAAFRAVRAQFRPTTWTVPPFLPADFIHDSYMVHWAAPGAAWVQVENSPVRWHKGWFYGDRQVSFSLPGFGTQKGKAVIYLGATPSAADQAYRLELTVADAAPKLALALKRGDQTLAEAKPEVATEKPEFVFELRGRYVLVTIDGKNVLAYGIPEGQS